MVSVQEDKVESSSAEDLGLFLARASCRGFRVSKSRWISSINSARPLFDWVPDLALLQDGRTFVGGW